MGDHHEVLFYTLFIIKEWMSIDIIKQYEIIKTKLLIILK